LITPHKKIHNNHLFNQYANDLYMDKSMIDRVVYSFLDVATTTSSKNWVTIKLHIL